MIKKLRIYIIAPLVSCLGLVILFPWGEGFVPENNPLAGPLWLLKTRSGIDFLFGYIIAFVLWPMIVAVLFKTNTLTVVLFCVGVFLWIYLGIFIAMGAAC